jgi:hypothetical protein
MVTRVSPVIETYTGVAFHPLDPRPADIRLEDVAHSLSLQCRFSGHCSHFYSVAEHSVRVSRACDLHVALWGLLHDSSEAYLVDLPSPLKDANVALGALYRRAEDRLLRAVAVRFGLPVEIPHEVGGADLILLATEVRDLMVGGSLWQSLPTPLDEKIIPWSARAAEQAYLARFAELTQLHPRQVQGEPKVRVQAQP